MEKLEKLAEPDQRDDCFCTDSEKCNLCTDLMERTNNMMQNVAWLSRQASVWWPHSTFMFSEPVVDPQQRGQHNDDVPDSSSEHQKMAHPMVRPPSFIQYPYGLQLSQNAPGYLNANATTAVSSTKPFYEQFSDISEPRKGDSTAIEKGQKELPPQRSDPPEGKDDMVRMVAEEGYKKLRRFHPSSAKERPRSAYTFYLKSFIGEYGAQHSEAPFDLGQLSSICAARWRKMPAEKKRVFEEMAMKDRQWFHAKIQAGIITHPPKRPLSAFRMFVRDEKAKVLEKHPEYRYLDMLRAVTNTWHSLDNDIKAVYKVQASLANCRFENALKDYVLSNLKDTEPLEPQLREFSREICRKHLPPSVLSEVMNTRCQKPSSES